LAEAGRSSGSQHDLALVPNMLKAVPAVAISYTVFETSKKELIGRGW